MDLVEGNTTAGSGGAPTVPDGGPPRPDTGANEDDGGASDGGGVDPSQCRWGECWWSTGEADSCRSAGLPRPADRPLGGDDTARLGDIYLGFTHVRLGSTNLEGEMTETAWEEFGFDLDGVCTNSASCSGVATQSCKSRGPTIPYDGQLCRDNTFARLQPVIAAVPELGEKFGLSEDVFNCQLWRGGYTMILRISGYNGELNDPRVRVDTYTSPGIQGEVAWECPSEDFMTRYPHWLSSRKFGVDQSWLTGPITTPGTFPDSKYADADAYVKQGYLVAQMPDGAEQGFIGDGNPYRGFMLKMQKAFYVGRLEKARDGTWTIQDGLASGRLRRDDLVKSFRNIGFCEANELSTWYDSMLDYLDENSDVLANGSNDPTQNCDAMSFAIGFEAAQLTPGTAVEVPAPIECCAPGRTREQCEAQCGDGKVSGDEKCDTAIAEGQPGACPTSCEPTNACTPQVVSGSGCEAVCAPMPITMIGAKDGCCPSGANTTTDSDCNAVCGNAVVERGETCDPASTCIPCAPTNACLPVRTTGSADTCNLRCEVAPITQCRNGDGCCPQGCSRANDGDCSSSCGNRVIDPGETCEANTNMPCPASCDDMDACTVDQATGSANNCNLTCTRTRITQAMDGDGCCPEGASANSDGDCAASCGNRVVEGDEQCDDGNTTAGDGCADCKTETRAQICKMVLGVDDACSQCTCAKCTEPAIACYGNPNAEDARLCRDMIQCGRDADCGNPDCFCGSYSLTSCLLGRSNGPCKEEVSAAARTSTLLEISNRATNTMYPLGRANAVSGCVDTNCAAECNR